MDAASNIHGIAELFSRHGVNARDVGDLGQRLAQQHNGIFDSRKHLWVEDWFLNQFTAAAGKGEQMPGNISAVNGRNVFWIERMKIARVVPVVEMAAKLFELANCVECGLDPLDCLRCSQPTEVARGESGEQVEPDIRGRSAVSDDGFGVFLEVVRWQEVFIGGYKSLEESPRAPRNGAKCLRFGRR